MTPSYAKLNNICLVFIASFLFAIALIHMRSALIPFVFSIFAYAALRPLVGWLKSKTKSPHGLAVALAVSLLTFTLTGLIFFVVHSVDNFVSGLSQYQDSIEISIQYLDALLNQWDLNINVDKIKTFVLGLPVFNYFKIVTSQIFSGLGDFALVLIFTLFLLSGDSTPSQEQSPLLQEIMGKISWYITAKTILSLATGFFVWLILVGFQVELAVLFALLTILLNFIPTIGSLVAIGLPIPVLILQFQLTWPFWVILTTIALIQFVIGNVVEPLVMGESLDLHPITLLICLIFWGIIWGIAGMFLAVPITAIVKIVLHRLPSTQSVAELMAGRIGANHTA